MLVRASVPVQVTAVVAVPDGSDEDVICEAVLDSLDDDGLAKDVIILPDAVCVWEQLLD
jgi:hypothetical protein